MSYIKFPSTYIKTSQVPNKFPLCNARLHSKTSYWRMGTSGSGQARDERWGFTGRSAYSWVLKVVGRAEVGAQEAGRIENFVFPSFQVFLKIAGRSASCVAVLLRFFLDVRGIVAALLPWCAWQSAELLPFVIDKTPMCIFGYEYLKRWNGKHDGMMSSNNGRMCVQTYCVWETMLLSSS
jgi:hypothetical protein